MSFSSKLPLLYAVGQYRFRHKASFVKYQGIDTAPELFLQRFPINVLFTFDNESH